jgi:hypothetical protein
MFLDSTIGNLAEPLTRRRWERDETLVQIARLDSDAT